MIKEENNVPNPETVRRIEVIDMALSFGADPETSLPLTDERRRLLEKEKELLEAGSTPDEVKEQTDLAADEDEIIKLLMGSQPTPTPEAEPQPTYMPGGGGVPGPHEVQTPVQNEGVVEGGRGLPENMPRDQVDPAYFAEQTPVQTTTTTPEAEEPTSPNPSVPVAPQPAPQSGAPDWLPPPAPAPAPSIGEQVKQAVTESLAQLLGTGGGGNSSLDDLLAKLDPRDSESALKMFTWLWENHRFQVIGNLNGGGYMLHYAEPKGTTQAGYIPGGTKGGRMVDQALATAKENPGAAHRGICPQCMSAVKKIDATGQVLSDDGNDNPECSAGGNHAFTN